MHYVRQKTEGGSMTSIFVVKVNLHGGSDDTELQTVTNSLKVAKYIRDSYRIAGLDAQIMVREEYQTRYREDNP